MKYYEHRYIEETLEQDRARFKPVVVVNSFLTDFGADATTGDGDTRDNEGVRTVGAIGSMHGILGTL